MVSLTTKKKLVSALFVGSLLSAIFAVGANVYIDNNNRKNETKMETQIKSKIRPVVSEEIKNMPIKLKTKLPKPLLESLEKMSVEGGFTPAELLYFIKYDLTHNKKTYVDLERVFMVNKEFNKLERLKLLESSMAKIDEMDLLKEISLEHAIFKQKGLTDEKIKSIRSKFLASFRTNLEDGVLKNMSKHDKAYFNFIKRRQENNLRIKENHNTKRVLKLSPKTNVRRINRRTQHKLK